MTNCDKSSLQKRIFSGVVGTLLIASLFLQSCSMLGTAPPPTTVEEYFRRYEVIIRTSVIAGVTIALETNPTYVKTVHDIATLLKGAGALPVTLADIQPVIMARIDWTKRQPYERMFAEALLAQIVTIVRDAKNKECAEYPASIICIDVSDSAREVQVYLDKFATWLFEAIYALGTSIPEGESQRELREPKVAFPIFAPLIVE